MKWTSSLPVLSMGPAAIALFLLAACGQPNREADASPASNRAVAEAAQFDFWLGEWDLTWADTARGTNSITAILDSNVILENFRGSPSIPLNGLSVSTYFAQVGKWKQTWVDNQAGYLDFVGDFKDGRMVLSRKTTRPNGDEIIQRIVWYNITGDELDWNWELSRDGGRTWQVNWQIHYQRRE